MNDFVTEFLKIGNFSSRQKDKMIELIVKDLTKQKVGETTENVPVSVIDPDEKSDKSKDNDFSSKIIIIHLERNRYPSFYLLITKILC